MKERLYYIDWIRIFLILSVFFFHVGMVFNGWDWHIKNDVHLDSLNPLMAFLHSWRMPLLFFVSGVGTRFALGVRTPQQYLIERTRRLLLPLVFGILVLVPVQVYVERIDSYSNLLDFYTHFFEGVYPEGNFSWHHLWFIVYLFFISIVFVPFIFFFRSDIYSRVVEPRFELMTSWKGGLSLFLVPLLLSQVLLRPYFPEETHAFYNDWAFMSLFFIYFFLGFAIFGNDKVVGHLIRQRRIWLWSSVISIALWIWLLDFSATSVIQITLDLMSLLLSWMISLTALSYGARYLNKNHRFRKPMNKAIYPFYLIHQPVLIVVGYWVLALPVTLSEKALLIMVGSLVIIVALYWLLVLKSRYLASCLGVKK